jgi:hypothetical protein
VAESSQSFINAAIFSEFHRVRAACFACPPNLAGMAIALKVPCRQVNTKPTTLSQTQEDPSMYKTAITTLLLGGLLAAGAAFTSRSVAFPPPKPGGPHGKHGPDHLRHAYDTLSEVALLLAHAEGSSSDRDQTLFDEASQLYRSALKAREDGQIERAGELGVAANDGGRGLRHLLRATLKSNVDLPPPPETDERHDAEQKARKDIRRAYDRASDARGEGYDKGPGQKFLEASRKVYNQARRAFEDEDYARAAELAKAAEAWTHVGEHLARADGDQSGEERRPPDNHRAAAQDDALPPPLD